MFITDEIQHFISNNEPTSKSFYTKLYKLFFKHYILQENFYRCVYCGSLATTLDHIICKNVGGQSLQSNLVGACQRCNINKGTNKWDIWYKQQTFYKETSYEYICNRINKNNNILHNQ